MDKETKKSIIFVVVGIIIVLAIILPIVINRNQENKRLKESFSRIGQAATDYIEDTKNANSYINDFSYDYTTGEVDYHPTITLEMYNRIKEGMTKEDVISILGKEDDILGKDEEEDYIIEYGDTFLSKGYWIHFTMDRKTNKVINKKQVGLK